MGFLDACREAREHITSRDDFLIVHHYDADGLSSGALVAAALERMNKNYSRLCFRKLSDREISAIAERNEKNVILVDLGSAQTEALEKISKNFVIIDHHEGIKSSILEVNPRLHGIDGSHEMCSASAAYFVFGIKELASFGVVGSVGDMQYPLMGWNRRMLEEGEQVGVLKSYKDINLFGRVSRTLIPFLVYCVDPYIPGLTNNEHNVAAFYDEIGIELKNSGEWRSYMDLSEQEKTILRSALVAYLYSKGKKYVAEHIISEVYELLAFPKGTELRDASEFSTLLNACGRHDKPDLGVNTLLMRQGAYEQAKEMLEYHRKALREGIEFALSKVVDIGLFHFLDARGVIDDGIIGVVAGMLYSTVDRNKPILAIALDKEGKIKVSTRGTKQLVNNGLDLGKALSESCADGVGVGGGHDIAAGATIEVDKLNQFMARFGGIVYEQLQK